MREEEKEQLARGISLARGHTIEEARKRVERLQNLIEEVERIEEWILNNTPDGQSREATLLLVIAKLLDKYRLETKEKLIRGLYKILIEEAYKNANEALLIKNMGQTKKKET